MAGDPLWIRPDAVRPSSGLVCAVSGSIVVSDGARLLSATAPLLPDSTWTELPGLADRPVLALAACRDLTAEGDQLFAVTSFSQLLSWTRRPDADAGAGAGASADGWQLWSPLDLDVVPCALTVWSGSPGHQELVVADDHGALWSQRRGWNSWSDWEQIGVVKDVVALDAAVAGSGAVELYAVTGEGELRRKIGTPGRDRRTWSSVETVAGWPDPAVAVTTWRLAEESEDQAVLLSTGVLQQRWRRVGDAGWSDWWASPAAPLDGRPLGLTGWAADADQVITVRDLTHLADRPWRSSGGWHPWSPAVPIAPEQPTEPMSGVRSGRSSDAPTEQPSDAPTGAPTDPSVESVVEAVDAVRAAEATVLFTGRELLPLVAGDPVQIGPFKVLRRIVGGQPSTDKYVARDGRGYCFLKVLKPRASAEEAAAFHREVAMAQRVVDRQRLNNYIDSHPGDDAQPPHLAMAFVPGQHLGEVLDRQALGEADLMALARSLVQGLTELQACGLIHADLKPANVIMRDGSYPLIVDYGSAVPYETTVITTAAFGTPPYAAPEFAQHRQVGASTDVHAWGVVLLAAANGATPSPDPAQRAAQLQRVPASVRELVAASLDPEPVNRPSISYLSKELGRTRSLADQQTMINTRLPVDAITPGLLPEPVRRGPRWLRQRLDQLGPWSYRAGLGIAVLAGSMVGMFVGLFLITLIRSA